MEDKDLFPVRQRKLCASTQSPCPIHLTSEGLICPNYSPGTGTAPVAGHQPIPPGLASAVGPCGCTLWLACPVSCVMIPPQVSLESGKSPGAVCWSSWPSSLLLLPPPPPLHLQELTFPWAALLSLLTSISLQLLAQGTSSSLTPKAGSISDAREHGGGQHAAGAAPGRGLLGFTTSAADEQGGRGEGLL